MKKILGVSFVSAAAVIAASTFVITAGNSVSCDAYPNEGSSVACDVYGEDSSQQLRVVVNGNELYGAEPVIVNGSTMVPLRAIFEALGAEVNWNADTKTALGYANGKSVQITVNSTTAYVNGGEVYLAQSAIIQNGSTLVPARFIAESLGADVVWNADTKTVVING